MSSNCDVNKDNKINQSIEKPRQRRKTAFSIMSPEEQKAHLKELNRKRCAKFYAKNADKLRDYYGEKYRESKKDSEIKVSKNGKKLGRPRKY